MCPRNGPLWTRATTLLDSESLGAEPVPVDRSDGDEFREYYR